MSNLVKLSYQPGEAPEEQPSKSQLSAVSTDQNYESTRGNETNITSSGTEETTESEESEEGSSTEEESPLAIRRSPVPILKVNPGNTGTPGLTEGGNIYVDAVEEQELGSKGEKTEAEQRPRKNSKSPERNITEETKSKPSLKIMNRVINLPLVQSALFVYDSAKELPCVGLAINIAEMGANLAIAPAVFFGSPFVNMCGAPIHGVDNVLCFGMDVAEKVFPCLQMTPSQIVGAAVNGTTNCVCCCPRTVCAVCNACGSLMRKEKLK